MRSQFSPKTCARVKFLDPLPAPHSRSDTKVLANSIANTVAFLGNHQCGTSVLSARRALCPWSQSAIGKASCERVAGTRISFKLVSVLDARQEVLFTFRECRRDTGSTGSLLLRQFSRPFAGRFSSPIALVEEPGTRFDSRPHTVAKAETTGCVRVFRRACDWQQRCRLR